MVKICDVCGNDLVLEKEHIYTVTENKGISSVLSPNEIYDATDCPKCGCQNIQSSHAERITRGGVGGGGIYRWMPAIFGG